MINFSQVLLSENKNHHFRDPSFSSYLNAADDSFVLKLAGTTQKLSPIITTIATQEEPIYMGKNKAKGGEIDVFGAEKYFNGVMDENIPVSLDPIKPKIQNRSVHSMSSTNSQSALLHNTLQKSAQTKAIKLENKSFFARLGCKCVCSDQDSVAIDESTNENTKKPINTSLDPIDLSQITKPLSQTWVMEKNAVKNNKEPRKSKEVFGSPLWEKRKLSLNIETSLPIKENYDTESDASSDLFELESLATIKSNPIISRQESNNVSGSATPMIGYAPSEASIEWSVITSSMVDYSVMSDCEEFKSRSVNTNNFGKKLETLSKNKPNKELPKNTRPSNLFGCNSYKSVKIVGESYRMNA